MHPRLSQPQPVCQLFYAELNRFNTRVLPTLSLAFERLSLWNCAEDLDQAIRDYLVLAVLELPDRKTKTVRVARMAMMLGVVIAGMIFTCRSLRIASPHAARPRSHAANPDRPGVGQPLHDFLPGNVQLRGINLPAVTRRHVSQSLRVELPRQRRHSEFLH